MTIFVLKFTIMPVLRYRIDKYHAFSNQHLTIFTDHELATGTN